LLSTDKLMDLSVKSQRAWLRRLTLIFMALIVFAATLAFIIVYLGLGALDDVDREHDTSIIASLFQDRKATMAKLLSDYGEWNDAFRNLSATENKTFADENLAFNLSNNYGIALSLVMRLDGTVWVKYRHGKPIAGQWELPPAMGRMAELLRHDFYDNNGAPENRGMVGFGMIGGKLHQIGVQFISKIDDATGNPLPLQEKPSLVLMAKELDTNILGAWGRVFKLNEVDFTPMGQALPPGRFVWPLRDLDGAELGQIHWRPEYSRVYLKKKIMPNLLLALTALLLLGGMYFWYLSRALAQQQSIADQVQKNRNFLKLIFDSDPTLIQVRDKEGRIYSANDAAARRYGYDSEQVQNAMLFDIDRDLTRARQNYEDDLRTIVTGREQKREEAWFDQDGTERLYATLRRPITALNGDVMALILATDITEQQQNFRDLAAAKLRAEDAARAKTEFLTTISHEIRTPMNGILGFSQLLQDAALSDEQREYIAIIQNSSRTLLAIINDVLDMSKIESGKMRLEKNVLDPAEVLDSVLAVVRPNAQEKNLQLTSEISGGRPPHVQGDAARLSQILLNIVNNAIKFTERGSVQIRLQAMINPRTVKLRFEVNDTGIGIEAQHAGKLFDKFSQADSSKARKYGGTGLGLSIAKELVEMMGGEIGVHSTPHQGSSFWFTVVLDKAA